MRHKKQKNPVATDLPQNPEFQEFIGNLRGIVSVPKTEVDRLLAEERHQREKSRTENDESDDSAGEHCDSD